MAERLEQDTLVVAQVVPEVQVEPAVPVAPKAWRPPKDQSPLISVQARIFGGSLLVAPEAMAVWVQQVDRVAPNPPASAAMADQEAMQAIPAASPSAPIQYRQRLIRRCSLRPPSMTTAVKVEMPAMAAVLQGELVPVLTAQTAPTAVPVAMVAMPAMVRW